MKLSMKDKTLKILFAEILL